MGKRSFAALLALCMLAGNIPVAGAASFRDVPSGHWAYSFIDRAAREGWVSGMPDGGFDPGASVSEAEFLTMVVRGFFPGDVWASGGGQWYAPYLEAAGRNGLTSGLPVDAASLGRPITRYQMASVLSAALSRMGVQSSPYAVQTAAYEIGDWNAMPSASVQQAVAAMYELGILSGVDAQNRFAGERTVDRAQAAVLLCRMADAAGTGAGAVSQPAQAGIWQSTVSVQIPVEPSYPAEPSYNVWTDQTGNRVRTVVVRSAGESAPAAPVSDPQTMIDEVVRLVNDERAKAGLDPLEYDSALGESAAVRAAELVSRFSHTRPNGTSCGTAMEESGALKGAYTWGENIAVGQGTPEQVMREWMNSDGHRGNILSREFTHIGVGYYAGAQGPYWVQDFAGK